MTALVSGYCIYKRTQVEALNKATSMAVDMETVESLAASQGKPVPEALADLKAQGVNAVVLSEETIGDLIGQGKASLNDHGLVLVAHPTLDSTVSVRPRLQELSTRIRRGLGIRFGKLDVDIAYDESNVRDHESVELAFPPTTHFAMVRQCPVGLNPDQAAEARTAGMIIIGRANNPQGVSGEYVRKTLEWVNELGATVYLPSGDQVLGRREAIEVTEKTLQDRGMLYASPEFTKLGGDEELVKEIPGSVVRLHSAQAAELDKMPLEDAVDRYSKASRERNMRILLLRPVTYASDKPLSDFAHFAELVNEKIRKDGGALGTPKPFTDSNIPWVVKLLLALSVIPTAYWVCSTFVRDPRWRMAGLVVLLALAFASKTHIGLTLFALGSAITFPLAAFLVLDARSASNSDGYFAILGEFLLTTAISLVGGFTVAGLLNSLDYFVKASEFQGIKLAVFAPILILVAYFLCRFEDMKSALRSPVTWLAALAALGMLAALMFMNARTGNDNPAGVSDLELKMRNVLDTLLFVRPRTKSFLIGHPFLFAGIGLMLWRAKAKFSAQDQQASAQDAQPVTQKHGVLAALLLTIGAIGQTDVVNTFCHLHTPFFLSLLRTGVALVPGVILGSVLWFFLKRGLHLKEAG